VKYVLYFYICGPGSSVGIVTKCWTVRESNLGGARFSAVQTGPGAHLASCTMGTGSFPKVKYGPGMLLTTHPLLVPRSWKSRAILLPTLWATTGPVTGTLYFYFCISTSCSMCAVSNTAVVCSSLISNFPCTLLRYCVSDSALVPVAPIITGITFVFTFHIR